MNKRKNLKCPTRADVAKRANVGVTVVSYVINNSGYVDAEKRKRVLQAIEDLNYEPNSLARAMTGKSSKHIMFIADNFQNGNFGVILDFLDKYAYEKGYLLSFCVNRNNEEFVRQILKRQLDGVIISSISFSEKYIQQLIDTGLNIVLFKNRDYENINGAYMITTGLYFGSREAIRYLYNQGRRNIIYIDRISQNHHFSTMSDFRYRGFVDEMESCGLNWTDNIISNCCTYTEMVKKLTIYMEHNRVDAIFARNDNIASISLETVLKIGKSVPTDVAVMGFDSSDISRFSNPSITTMEVDRENVAKVAIDIIVNINENNIDNSNFDIVQFRTKLIERDSTYNNKLENLE